jgi:hypothetical protein
MKETIYLLFFIFLLIISIVSVFICFIYKGEKGNSGKQGIQGVTPSRVVENTNYQLNIVNKSISESETIKNKNGFLYQFENKNLQNLNIFLDSDVFRMGNFLVIKIDSKVSSNILISSNTILNSNQNQKLQFRINKTSPFSIVFEIYSIQDDVVSVSYNSF